MINHTLLFSYPINTTHKNKSKKMKKLSSPSKKSLSIMAKFFLSPFLLLLLLLLLTTITTAAARANSNHHRPTAATITAPTPAPTPSKNITTTLSLPPTPPLSKSLEHDQKIILQEQLYNIIDALLGAGDFQNWANVLTMADPATFPISATFFIPADYSLSPAATTTDPFIFPYHIVPQRLSFADLRQVNTLSRLPTLLLDKYILITNNSLSNFTLDGSPLTHPDIFTNAAIAVHGIAKVLDYNVYGENSDSNLKPTMVALPPTPPPLPTSVPAPAADDGELIVDAATCLCTEVWTFFLVVCVVLATKFPRMNLGR